jgi:hypothetical protein
MKNCPRGTPFVFNILFCDMPFGRERERERGRGLDGQIDGQTFP